MSRCECYCKETRFIPLYSPFTGQIVERKPIECGVCNGTKERDECSCEGERSRCDFYHEVREKALNESDCQFGEWISVEDRLPERYERVLCYHKYEPDSPDVICENTYYSGRFWLSDGSKVTHWMPLPEPPKEERG